MTTRVDGRDVATGATVLATCRTAGATVPVICHDERVPGSGGHCRACMVELDGRVVAACTTPARDGSTIETATPRLVAYRRDLGELVASEAELAGPAGDLVRGWGTDGTRYLARPRAHHRDATHPYLRLDLDRCVRCRLCEGACAEVQGRFAYGFVNRGAATELGWGGGRFVDSRCVGCGACASVCPTGAVTDVDRLAAAAPTQIVRTTCGYCGVGCQLDVHVAADSIAHIDGGDAAPNHRHLCIKGRYAHRFVRHRDRLTTPLIRRNGKLEPCSWPEAIAAVAQGMLAARGAVGALSSSRCTNEENYLVQKWMRGGLGTNNVDCCARVCHAPSARGMRESFGTGAATNSFADLDLADLILVAGSNATEAHPIVGARIVEATLRGTRLLVIDPRKTELAELADVHLQLRPGTNVVLLDALAHVIVLEDLVNHAFVDARTEGWDAYRAHVLAHSLERAEAITGVPAVAIRKAARLYATAKRPMQVHGLGITEHYQGSESVMQLCNLALLVGAVGRPGTGVNPLRGQNNVQGAADMGCQPDLATGYAAVDDPAARARFANVWGRPLPAAPGLDLPQMYGAARDGKLRALFILGEDVVQTDPSIHVGPALDALDFLVVQELFMTDTAKRAHVVLPGTSFLEKDGTFTNGERRIQRVRGAVSPCAGARPDWQVLCDLMAATGWPQPFAHPGEIFDEIARVAPSFAGASYDRLADRGLQWPVPDATHPGTAILHTASFPRGRAKLSCIDYLPSPSLANNEGYPLRLVTGRVLAHYNNGSMTRRTDDSALAPRDLLELDAGDANRFGIADGDRVVIESPWGQVDGFARTSPRIAPGTAFLSFHFPESATNHLVGPVVDRLADCPEYKVTPIRVRRA